MQVHEVGGAISLQNVVPFFQPIIDVQDNTVWSYECLARMLTDNQQTFLPSEFLYLIEKEQCVGHLTEHIFHLSAQYFRHQQVNWSINISEQDVLSPQTMKFLQDYLSDYPDAHRVTLEITAHTAVHQKSAFRTFLLVCKALGLKLVVDHFGGLASSIEDLLELPIDGIKIDGQLLVQLAATPESKSLLSSIQKKARQNDVAIIAERIEDKDTMDGIRALKVRYGQGFHISHPQSDVVD